MGGYCVRRTGDGITTRYVHIGSYTVNDGESVESGVELGRVGKTGSAWTGYHLHFELHIGSERVDPLEYLGGQVAKLSLHFQGLPDWAAVAKNEHISLEYLQQRVDWMRRMGMIK